LKTNSIYKKVQKLEKKYMGKFFLNPLHKHVGLKFGKRYIACSFVGGSRFLA
jgi:hypothetical protein